MPGVSLRSPMLSVSLAVGALGWPMAVASSSKNANQMMRQIHLDSGRSLLEVFTANVCGRDLRQGKPNPEIFLLAAAELHVAPAHCFVVEDAPAGIEAACAASRFCCCRRAAACHAGGAGSQSCA